MGPGFEKPLVSLGFLTFSGPEFEKPLFSLGFLDLKFLHALTISYKILLEILKACRCFCGAGGAGEFVQPRFVCVSVSPLL